MSKSRNLRSMGLVLALVGAMGGAGMARAANLPPLHTQGAVTWVSGGIGQDQAKAFEAQAGRWPLMLEFVAQDGKAGHDAFLADVSLQIVDAGKAVVLQTRSDGPFVLARLQPGTYEVKATCGGKTLTRRLQVSASGTAREVFVWPAAAAHAAG